MRLKFAVLAMSAVAFSLSSNLASAAGGPELGQKVIRPYSEGANYVGIVTDKRGDRIQVEIQSVSGAHFGLSANECTGNRHLEGYSGSRGVKIWIPSWCVDPM